MLFHTKGYNVLCGRVSQRKCLVRYCCRNDLIIIALCLCAKCCRFIKPSRFERGFVYFERDVSNAPRLVCSEPGRVSNKQAMARRTIFRVPKSEANGSMRIFAAEKTLTYGVFKNLYSKRGAY
jgi:hypothetical protein